MREISDRTVRRLSLYRRILGQLVEQGRQSVYSHELAQMTGATAEQVRRDLMAIEYSGSPMRGYDSAMLLESVSRLLDAPEEQRVALVGVGNLGRAIIAYFFGRRPRLCIVAGFDTDPAKAGTEIQGCPCYPMTDLERIVRQERIDVGVITTPASSAQAVADALAAAGARGVLNFAPVTLNAPPGVFVEQIDMSVALATVAFYARQGMDGPGPMMADGAVGEAAP